jgi:hypothetical protein
MTPAQLSAVRAQLDAASVVRALMFVNMEASDLRALLDEVERLTAWQVEVADGLGYLNRAEGQGGYEVADPETVIGAWREQEREVERLTMELHASQAEVVELHADPLPAAAWVREVQHAAFRRGAEAMRTALLQRVSWGSDLADRIRDEPVPEDRP